MAFYKEEKRYFIKKTLIFLKIFHSFQNSALFFARRVFQRRNKKLKPFGFRFRGALRHLEKPAFFQRLLQHSSAAVTQRYIGIEPERIERAIEGHARLM